MSDEPHSDNSEQNPEPTIGSPFKTGRLGERIFESWIPPSWLIRKQEPDVFIDYIVEIVETGEPSGQNFAAQVKGIEVDHNSSTPLRFQAIGKHVRYWLRKCQQPVFVFLIDVRKRSGHWVFVQKYALERLSKIALDKQKTVTLRFHPAIPSLFQVRFLRTAETSVSCLKEQILVKENW